MEKNKPKLDEYYACTGQNLVLYRYQPFFTHFIFRSCNNRGFIENYRINDSFPSDENKLKQDLLNKQSLPPEMLKSMEWVICIKKTKQAIGLAGLVNYHSLHQSAELLIGLLPELKSAQQSYGPEATLLVLEFAFQQIQLHKLTSLVYGYNQKAQQSTLKLGFTEEGLLRQHMLDRRLNLNSQALMQQQQQQQQQQQKTPQYLDLYYNGLLKDDFIKNKKLARLSQRLLRRDITQKIPQPASQETAADTHILTETLIPGLLKQRRNNAL
ncbi:MAG: GNAT family protein [Pseudomonadota bacterium]